MKLYHGTSAATLPSILKEGIKPRGRKPGNYTATVKSNAQAVYLTTAYPLFFAQNSSEVGENLAILEIDTDNLDSKLLCADEDALEQISRGVLQKDCSVPLPPEDWDMKRRTVWWRARHHLYKADASLGTLGTCCYRGTVPTDAITRVAWIHSHVCHHLIMGGFDPVICIQNYKIVGKTYEEGVQWLFGDNDVWDRNPTLSRDGIIVAPLIDLIEKLNCEEKA